MIGVTDASPFMSVYAWVCGRVVLLFAPSRAACTSTFFASEPEDVRNLGLVQRAIGEQVMEIRITVHAPNFRFQLAIGPAARLHGSRDAQQQVVAAMCMSAERSSVTVLASTGTVSTVPALGARAAPYRGASACST
jgi:hypothetical protein